MRLNSKNAKFKQIFPEYATPQMKRLPNMGEADIGKPDGPPLPANLGDPNGPKPGSGMQGVTAAMENTSLGYA